MTKKGKKEERRRKKLFLMIFMILFVGIVLTASTYAWFTTNSSVTVEGIDVNVSTSQGLQISTDAKNWKSIVSNDDITGAVWDSTTSSLLANQFPTGQLSPVSSAGIVSGARMQMFSGSVETDVNTKINQLTTASLNDTHGSTGDYIAFDLFFRTVGGKKESETDEKGYEMLYLAENSKVEWKSGPKGIENAARIAFVVLGNTDYSSQPDVAQMLASATDPWIWEPNYDAHRASARTHANQVYGMDLSTFTGNDSDGYKTNKLDYLGVKAATTNSLPLNSNDTNVFQAVTTNGTPASGITESSYTQMFKIQGGITKVRIYMWIEGQDIDCEDLASSGKVSFSLQFSIKENANAAA